VTPRATTLLRRPVAWAPVAMSIAALTLVLGYVVLVGPDVQPAHDDRAPARQFQLILLAQGLTIALFAIRWLPRAPRPTALILALQLVVAAIPVGLLVVLEARA